MKYFNGLVQNEWMKATSKRQLPYYYIFLALLAIGIGVVMRLAIGGRGEYAAIESMNVSISVLLTISSYFFIVVASQTITDEFKDGTIKQILIRPASRTMVLMSKLVNLLLIMLSVYVLAVVLSAAVGFILFSGDTTMTIMDVLRQTLLSLPSALFYMLFAFMVAVLTRSLGLAISIPIIIQSLSGLTMFMANKSWYKFLIFPNLNWEGFITGNSNALPYEGATFLFTLVIYVIYMLIPLLASNYAFNSRDIQ